MTLLDLAGSADTHPFTIALAIMLGIAALEGVLTLVGLGLFQMLDSLIPDFDLDADVDVEIDTDPSAEAPDTGAAGSSFLMETLGWLCIGRVPFLVLTVIFLTIFGLTGWIVQIAAHNLTATGLPVWMAVVAALISMVLLGRTIAAAIARVMPKDETEAVSRDSFVGESVTVTIGTARSGAPAQAKLQDRYGKTHYVMIEPENPDETIPAGGSALITARRDSIYLAMADTRSA